MQLSSKLKNPLRLCAIVSFWIVLVANIPFWTSFAKITNLGEAGIRAWLFALTSAGAIFFLQLSLFSLFAFKKTVKVWLIVLLVVAALCSYFMRTFGVVIDKSMIVNSVQTDVREVKDLLSLGLLLTLIGIVIPAGIVISQYRLTTESFIKQSALNLGSAILSFALAIACIFTMFQDFSSLMRNNKTLRFQISPLNALWSTAQVALDPFRHANIPLQQIGEDAKLKPSNANKPKLIILIVGETARAANFSMNGYERMTNPRLSALDVVNFTNVSSCGTSTATSLPCMFSHLGKDKFEASNGRSEGLLDVLKKAGVEQLWRNNNSGCKGACDRIPSEDVSRLKHPQLCTPDECFDEILLDQLDEKIQSIGTKNIMFTLHQKGSHGPAYYLRVPNNFRKFLPECLSNQLPQCEREAIVNSYDNTILYTDHVIAQAVELLKRQSKVFDTGLLYVSDHGESLGESGTYLHGLPYAFAPKVQKHVPMVIWLSEPLKQRLGVNLDCLKSISTQPISHDNLFHTLLKMNEVETNLYQAAKDIFAQCTK